MQGTSRKSIYDESLKEMRWYCLRTFFYKIVNRLLPDYLQSHTEASFQHNYPFRSISTRKLKVFPSRTKSFKKTFSHTVLMNGINLTQKLKMQNLYKNSKNKL